MDPNACLERWRDAESRSERSEAYRDLLTWLNRGGFEPDWRNNRERSHWLRSEWQCPAPPAPPAPPALSIYEIELAKTNKASTRANAWSIARILDRS